MNKIKLIALLIALISMQSFAQKNVGIPDEAKNMNYPFGIGPYIFLKGGVNAADVPQGIKNGVAFVPMPDFGVTGYIPLTSQSKLGILIDLGYTSYAYQLKFTGAEDNPWTEKFNYITIGPGIHLSGFMLGFNIGLPMGGKGLNDAEHKAEDLATSVEVKVGGVIPLFENHFGRINLLLSGGYFLTGQYKDTDFNPHPASLGIGLNYMFNLQKPVQEEIN